MLRNMVWCPYWGVKKHGCTPNDAANGWGPKWLRTYFKWETKIFGSGNQLDTNEDNVE
jgi:hypothetical protein